MSGSAIKTVRIGLAKHPEDDSKAIICVFCDRSDVDAYEFVISSKLAEYEASKGRVLTDVRGKGYD